MGNDRNLPEAGMASPGSAHVAGGIGSQPLYRNALAWMISTVAASGLGILYWILAGRLYTSEAVGLSAAVISAMIFLSGVSQLNLSSALIRFLPQAGKTTGRLVAAVYAASVGAAILIGGVILLGLRIWQASSRVLDLPAGLELWIFLSVIAWSIFNLQDGVLTGLRDAVWVPVENIFFAVSKIVLLVALSGVMPEHGIFASWMIPVAVLILPINILIFRRLIPRHVRSTTGDPVQVTPATFMRYTAGNYLGALFTLGSTRLLPVLVTQQAGAQIGAYFYLPWTIANSLKLVATNMAMPLTAEGARDGRGLAPRAGRFLLGLAGVFTPIVGLLVLAAPTILGLSGGRYAAEGTALFRLMLLSVIPALLTSVAIGVARVRNAAATIAAAQGLFCILVLGLSAALLERTGITGVGIAFLASEAAVAVFFLLKHRGYLSKLTAGRRLDRTRIASWRHFVPIKKLIAGTTPPAVRRGLLVVRDRTTDGIARYRQRTGRTGSLPGFLIIGTQKGGTTYLYDELCKHPDVFPALNKEVHFFDDNFGKGLDWYRAFFRPPAAAQIGEQTPCVTGEASPSYLFHPLAPARIAEVLPEVKLIAMLRNPVQRAYSHYHHEVRLGFETRSFDDAIRAERLRLASLTNGSEPGPVPFGLREMHDSYLARGNYIDQLQRWRMFFPEDQLLVIKSEDFFRDSRAVIRQVTAFLGLPDWKPADLHTPKSFTYDPLAPGQKQELADFFEPANRRLYEFMRRDYGWNE